MFLPQEGSWTLNFLIQDPDVSHRSDVSEHYLDKIKSVLYTSLHAFAYAISTLLTFMFKLKILVKNKSFLNLFLYLNVVCLSKLHLKVWKKLYEYVLFCAS